MKKLITIVFTLVLACSIFAGCQEEATPTNSTSATTASQEQATPTNSAAESTSSEEEPVPLSAEIDVWYPVSASSTMSQDLYDLYWKPAFEEEFPDVEVNFQILAQEGISEKLQIALATGSTPDLYHDSSARTMTLLESGLLAEVNDIIEDYGDNIYESLRDIGMVDDSYYLIPSSCIYAYGISVNTTLAKELGTYALLPEDRVSWTLDEYVEFVKQCSIAGADQGIYGTAFFAASSTSDVFYYSMILSNGGAILNEDHTVSMINSPQAVKVMDTLMQLYRDGYVVPGAASMKSAECTALFNNSKIVASYAASPKPFIQMYESGEISSVPTIEIYAYPSTDGNSAVAGSFGMNQFAIFTNEGDEDKINAAKEFIRTFFENTDIIETQCLDTGTAPCVDYVTITMEDPILNAYYEQLNENTGKYANMSFGILETYWQQIRNAWYPELQAVFNGEKTTQKALSSVDSEITRILADAN